MEKVLLVNVILAVWLLLEVNGRPGRPNCPPDKPKVYCFVQPCDESSCGVKGASCFSSSCGGCEAIWTDSEGRRLNDKQCEQPLTTTTTTPKTTAANSPVSSSTTSNAVISTEGGLNIKKQPRRRHQSISIRKQWYFK